jgi:uncharacterized repeat protein (TIGR01451 family)
VSSILREKIRLLLGVLSLVALVVGLSVTAESPATAQSTNTLTLTKTDRPDPVNVGQDLIYTLTVRNNGSGTANNVSITDPLPANVTFVFAGTRTPSTAAPVRTGSTARAGTTRWTCRTASGATRPTAPPERTPAPPTGETG